ncbi:MAG: DNA polymerase subunit beta [Thermofilum sp. ex4484_82]|nr:MAG: DNA polymerase subunit beta [Thermofilum sp. ex4484_82]OYT36481.1 MAG: DNA polymerase subunit beta [Archaeoglobales archaeon ex4484_92]RLE86022.1 MAG: nucleotidyltransferase domain-containing protein [Thermoprotei archaeon]
MAGKTLIDLELETLKEWKKYYDNPRFYIEKVKAIARKHDKQARVMLFGSIIKGNMRPNSDIDVLLITRLAENVDDRIKLRVEISREIGDSTPFEIHIITPREYENWYKRFIDKYLEL